MFARAISIHSPSAPHMELVRGESRVYLYNSSSVALGAIHADLLETTPGVNQMDRVDGLGDGVFAVEQMAYLGWVENRRQTLEVISVDGRRARLEFDLSSGTPNGILFWRIQDADFRK